MTQPHGSLGSLPTVGNEWWPTVFGFLKPDTDEYTVTIQQTQTYCISVSSILFIFWEWVTKDIVYSLIEKVKS